MRIEEKKGQFTAKDEQDRIMGLVTYKKAGEKSIELDHTEVEDEHKGKGIASVLVKSVADYARQNSLHVIPTCPYAVTWFEKHEEEKDLL